MNVLILMGGDSKAFFDAGYAYPNALIEVGGIPVIQRVYRSICALRQFGGRNIYVLRSEDARRFYVADAIKLLDNSCVTIEMPGETAGAACSALLATGHVQGDEPLLIVNGDSLVTADLASIVKDFTTRELDGGIVVFEAIHPRWSYVKKDERGNVIETAEKRPISKLATAGIYYFRTGDSFVESAKRMISKDGSVEGKFYICPVYNELILTDSRIGVAEIARHQYFSLSTPQGVKIFEDHRTRLEHPEASLLAGNLV